MSVNGFTGNLLVSTVGGNFSLDQKESVIGFGEYNPAVDQRLDVGTILNSGFVVDGASATVTGVISGATATLVQYVNALGFTFIGINEITGTFQVAETLTMVNSAGAQTVRGTVTAASVIPLITSDSYGPRILVYNATPNGVVLAPAGSLCLCTNGALGPFVNTDGSTTWVTLR